MISTHISTSLGNLKILCTSRLLLWLGKEFILNENLSNFVINYCIFYANIISYAIKIDLC